jgi:hypothetical protein
MQLDRKHFCRGSIGKFGSYRLLHWFVLVIVTLQLIGAGFHHHDVLEESDDCVSCYMVAHVPSPMPPVSLDVLPSLTILPYQIASLPIYLFVAQQSYLIPHAQAPPHIIAPTR